MNNNDPERYTLEVAFADLVVGTRYKIDAPWAGKIFVGTYIKKVRSPGKKTFELPPSGGGRVFLNVGPDDECRFYAMSPLERRKHAVAAWTGATGYNIRAPRKSRKSRKSCGGRQRSTRRRRV